MRELAQLVIAETKSLSKIISQPLPQDDPKQRKPDISLASKYLGWAPTIELAKGLTPTTAYLRSIAG
jgi:UDP-glucuronate decarboxylase